MLLNRYVGDTFPRRSADRVSSCNKEMNWSFVNCVAGLVSCSLASLKDGNGVCVQAVEAHRNPGKAYAKK